MKNWMYEKLEDSGGSFRKFHWNASGFTYKVSEEVTLSAGNYIWYINGLRVSDSVAESLFETNIYPQFLKDKKVIDKCEKKMLNKLKKYKGA